MGRLAGLVAADGGDAAGLDDQGKEEENKEEEGFFSRRVECGVWSEKCSRAESALLFPW
jgi:hypothetical protein